MNADANNERIIGILEDYLTSLSNIPMEEQKSNPALMVAVANSITQMTGLLLILKKR